MPSDDLRARLEAMNGGPLKIPMSERGKQEAETKPVELKTEAVVELPRSGRRRRSVKIDPNAPFVPLEECAPGVETVSPIGEPFYLIETPIARVDDEAQTMAEGFSRLFPPHSARVGQHCCVPHATAEHTLFLDLETAGLGSAPVFLVGTLSCENGELISRQYLARSYSEEVAILAQIAQQMRDVHLLITFNGARFDEPYLKMRAAASGIRWTEADGHLDLLGISRLMFKRQLPNCKLQTLERYVCGRIREDDIPGAEIPDAYHEFARTKNAYRVGKILEHNLLDMVTMVALVNRLFG